jgi:integrase
MDREYAAKAGIDKSAPHDLRRTCARLCHAAGGELEHIQFLLNSDNRTISRLQTAHSRCCQRQNWNRATGLREPLSVRFADDPREARQEANSGLEVRCA